MSDWVYIAGEGGFNQDFIILDQQTNEPVDLTGATATMFIKSTDLVTSFPNGGTTMTITDNAAGIQVARLVVQNTFMPQDANIYLAQIEIQTVSLLKTFILNLRVIRSLT